MTFPLIQASCQVIKWDRVMTVLKANERIFLYKRQVEYFPFRISWVLPFIEKFHFRTRLLQPHSILALIGELSVQDIVRHQKLKRKDLGKKNALLWHIILPHTFQTFSFQTKSDPFSDLIHKDRSSHSTLSEKCILPPCLYSN